MNLDCDALDLIEGNVVAGAVVELRCLRRFVVGDLLRMLQRAAVSPERGDAGGPERVVVGSYCVG